MSNASEALPGIKITLDKERNFKLDLMALCKLEKRLKMSVLTSLNWQELGISDLTLILYAGLLHDDPELDYDQFVNGLDLQKLMKLAPVISEQIAIAFPAPSTDSEKKTQPERAKS